MKGDEASRAVIFLNGLRLPALLGCVVIASAWNASTPSFGALAAPIKLGVGLVHLVLIGRACSCLLRLDRARVLPAAQDALLGQVACLAYVYVRSFFAEVAGLPGISIFEATIAEALLFAWAITRADPPRISFPASAAVLGASACLAIAWLGWLGFVASQKLDLYYTPSSDPDIHAYYAKLFLERGHVYYDLLPRSDAWMVYPSTFASLNFVWGRLSGLHPVQLVNVAAYTQLALFAGASFSVLASLDARSSRNLLLAVVHFSFVYLGFNAVFTDHRSFLEGTPRLAHTALLFFPLLFALQNRVAIARRPLLWTWPWVGVALGACVNPTHVPASLLFGAAAFAPVAHAWRGFDDRTGARPRVFVSMAAVSLAIALLFIWTDPFYRGLVRQQSAPHEARDAATDLTGAAFANDVEFANVFAVAMPAAARELLGAGVGFEPQRVARRVLLIAGLGIFAWSVARRRARPTPSQGASSNGTELALTAGAVVILHGIWAEFAPEVGTPGVLQSRLLSHYTRALQEQITLSWFALLPGLLVVTALDLFDRTRKALDKDSKAATSSRRIRIAAVVSLLLASTPFLVSSGVDQATRYYAELRNSPLGPVYRQDADFAKQVEAEVAETERVLLPGRLRRIPGEHWVFTTDAGRALPLFSDVRTSFFLGLDGAAFTAGAYEAHVAPPGFDPDWLHEKQVYWLLDSGNFPARLLNRHYEPVLRGEHSILWRLRDAPPREDVSRAPEPVPDLAPSPRRDASAPSP